MKGNLLWLIIGIIVVSLVLSWLAKIIGILAIPVAVLVILALRYGK